ncbi:MAG: sigma-54 dependent transcriptional regulator [Planctomycetota bacterium]
MREREDGGGGVARAAPAAARDILITDVNLGAAADGFRLLQEAHAIDPGLAVLMITGYGSIPKAVSAIKAGAEDYIAKPIDDQALLVVVRRCLERRQLRQENRDLKQALTERWRHALIATDPRMMQVMRMVDAAADTRATVRSPARAAPARPCSRARSTSASSRRAMAFVEVNCGALPENLLESELFGHVRGAFTGALRDKVGKFEHAGGGTIFLDEISTASPALQVKLLRVLQDRVIERVGGLTAIEVDVRVILATNTDLESAVKQGLSEDLYYRINVVSLRLPCCASAPRTCWPLAHHFLKKYALENARPVPVLTAAALARLQSHAWPGNVRELDNAMQRAVIMGTGPTVDEGDLPAAASQRRDLLSLAQRVRRCARRWRSPSGASSRRCSGRMAGAARRPRRRWG